MFTGIIEDLGSVESIKLSEQGGVITVSTVLPTAKMKIGDSIAVNGCCLTVVAKGRGKIAMDVSAESLRCTTLGSFKAGDRVNLERCLTLGKLLGGHMVAGHVDGVGKVISIKPEGESSLYTFEVRAAQAQYLVEKGSVAIDGISLTVFGVKGRTFSVEVIPHTLKVTTLGFRRAGDAVNIESDMMMKYVERILVARGMAGANAA
jgi:riboflavin synthase